MIELRAPAGGMWIHTVNQDGATADWACGLGVGGSLITTGGAAPTVWNVRDDVGPGRATTAGGAAVTAFAALCFEQYPTGQRVRDWVNPLYIPAGRRFFVTDLTANEQFIVKIRWTEPGF
jgi:hypothetical protein